MKVKFGTSGWRGIIAKDFTFENLKICLQAIIKYFKENNLSSVIIGYDTRFLAEEFARYAATYLASNEIKVYFCDRDTPTPVISYEIIHRKLDGGIHFTASHNPPIYQGLKFIGSNGASPLKEVTSRIESYIEEIYPNRAQIEEPIISFESLLESGKVQIIDPSKDYIESIKKYIDIDVIRNANITVVYDAMYGTGRDYTDKILRDLGVNVISINNYRDALFGGHAPEPSTKNLTKLSETVLSESTNNNLVIGIANDGDADRYAVVDSDGTYVDANYLLAILFDYALKYKPTWKGSVVRSVGTTHLIDKIAEKHSIKVHEVPVGFKYIGDIMLKEDIIVGGEESNGLSVNGHIPEKDGILACLLFVEIFARIKVKFGEYIQNLMTQYGSFVPIKASVKLTEEQKVKLIDILENDKIKELNGQKVVKVNKLDGIKLITEDGTWALLRFSGTEPLVRLYAESSNHEKTEALISYIKNLVVT
ncbi:MAG: phosphoglucomutase/phosphomannomutase family protein [Candidatus Dojkabacteria bacterium]|nr:phosphoglucomutase/phosphomannomutase family protein [Candidatus Dojkabacteria bacterium]